MLARLSMAVTSRLLDSSIPPDEEDTIILDIHALRLLPDFAWGQVATACGRIITPIYTTLHNMLTDDLENVAHVLSALEPLCDDDFEEPKCETSPRPAVPVANGADERHKNDHERELLGDTSPPLRPRRKRRRSPSPVNHPLLIPSTHPLTPTIIITPCPTQPIETFASSHVPYQNSEFRNKLTVPCHPRFNEVFPPLALPLYTPTLPVLQNWKWVDGHWHFLVPGLNEQAQKGMFSRAVLNRKRRRNFCAGPSKSRGILCLGS